MIINSIKHSKKFIKNYCLLYNNNNNNHLRHITTFTNQNRSINKLITNDKISNKYELNKREYSINPNEIKDYISDLKEDLIEKFGKFDRDKVDREYILNKEDINYYLDQIPNNESKKLKNISPPLAQPKEYQFEIHNTVIEDPYHWLQNFNDPNVQEYIHQENNYAESYQNIHLKKLSRKIRTIYKRVFVDHPIDSEIINGHKFIVKNKTLYRQRISDGRTQRLLIDGDSIGSGYTILLKDVISFKFSEDDGLFAFVMEVDSSEKKICVVKKLSEYHSPLLDIIENVTSIEWGKENDLYYTQPDEKSHRPHKLFKKLIFGSAFLNDEADNPPLLIMDEPNPSNFLDIVKSKDNQFLFYCSNNKASNLVYYINLEKEKNITAESHKVMLSRVEGLEYYAEHNNDQFIIFANANKGDLNIYTARDTIENGGLNDLELLVASENGCVIRDVDMYQDYLVLLEQNYLTPRIRIINKNHQTGHFDPTNEKIVKFPQEIIQISLGVNINYNADDEFSLTYTTPVENVTPAKVSLQDGSITILPGSKERGPLVLNPSNYVTKILWVPSKSDPSIKIPLSIAYHKDLKLDGKNPCILHGYGSYGNINELTHSLEDIFFLNGGMIVAKAHVRGGGELGRAWYKDGKLLNKKNSFKDYIDCVEYLFEHGYTSPEYLIGKGSSAGGLLMCNVSLTHPHYFSAIISRVPFVDIITAMMDEELPLTIHEFDEWGNVNKDKEAFEYIKEYDPYLLIDTFDVSKFKSFPDLYVTGSSSDFRVPFWQPLKWVAKLRNYFNNYNNNNNNNNNIKPLIFLNIDDGSGHFGPNDRDSLIINFSKEISFIFNSIKNSIKRKEINDKLNFKNK
ncbi:hypothetical protein DICPUDRAFT_52377 [Dictyostelium purpureum]|uniref:Prolyl endopeptidase n=1 Tax=Dictyostelium purpureum TaxID=5786 RepID=F0Z822_DICPU|nr:uncharacterized protein DICPUDRAFT_52377 [Dictyostelium purpureum]EGC39915.1 hypothetical protein DICPUDRAFT_52377 [Dictyostelium purpureum]|eukprot:XP_003283544.1 hypothetical protein DICPUDRAFT_52377 [Dictyostelium purpureum]